MQLSEKDKARFLSKIRMGRPDECWEWTAGIGMNEYGEFRIGRQMYAAHRITYELFKGEISEGLCVLHRCDNRKCCSPFHLWLGTKKENSMDMVIKGRGIQFSFPKEKHPMWGKHLSKETRNKISLALQGEKHPNAKLTETQVREIKTSTLNQSELGRIYGVARSTIQAIKENKSWAWLK